MRGLFSDTWRKNPDTTIFVCATWLWRCKATPCPLSSACLVLDCCAIKNVLLNFALCLVLPQPSKPQPEPSLFVGQLLRKDETKLGTQDASRRPSWPQASEWPRRDARSVNNTRGFPTPQRVRPWVQTFTLQLSLCRLFTLVSLMLTTNGSSRVAFAYPAEAADG